MLFLFSVCLQSHGSGGRHHGAACAEDRRDGSCDHERLVGVDDPHWTPPVSGELSGALRAETGRFVQGDTAFRISSTLLWATGGRIGIYAFLPGVVGALPVAGALHCAAPRLAAE